MPVLYGVHDREGRHIVPSDGWIVDTVALSENPTPTDYITLRGDINWIVRANWGYGSTGTIPLPQEYHKFAAACAQYVAGSPGVKRVIIGNEPNHEQERPLGMYITPAQYAECFVRCRDAIKRFSPQVQVIPAPCAPYHASPVDWLAYWREMLTIIARNGGCDGIAVHAYTRSSDPYDINDNDIRMGPPLAGQFAGFLTYIDALAAVPESLRHLPAYITEFNELLPDGWHDANTGVVQAAYQSIHGWNQTPGTQKFQCLCLYRWPRYDKWHLEGKQGVIDDFRAAVAFGYPSPIGDTLNVTTPSPTPTAPDLPREIDPRLTERGVTIETPPLQPGQQYWRVTQARWFSEAEAGGRHHIYVEAIDQNGQPIDAVPFEVVWPDDRAVSITKAGRGFDAGNFPMSPSRNEFGVGIDTEYPTETLRGIGMGAETPGGFNAGIHTSTLVTFQLATVPQAQPQPDVVSEGPVPAQPAGPTGQAVPQLAHPIADPGLRVISQRFGDNPADYARFGLAGHTGIDFAVPMATPVHAVDAGQVMEAGAHNDYGLYIKLRHLWGESLYAHLSSIRVSHGEPVGKGEPIALSGNTGNSTGPHLHFAIRIFPYQRGAPYDGFSDPMPYLQDAPVPRPSDVLTAIKAAAQEFGVEWQLLASQAWAESSFNPEAESAVGAMGLFQIMPATWDEWGPRIVASAPFFAGDNARVGAAYMRFLLSQTDGNVYRALHAYVWGIGRILNGTPPPDEVIAYAAKIVHGRDLLKACGL